jgi:hypothetical protein
MSLAENMAEKIARLTRRTPGKRRLQPRLDLLHRPLLRLRPPARAATGGPEELGTKGGRISLGEVRGTIGPDSL